MKTIAFDLDGTLVQLSPTLISLCDRDELAELRTRYNFALVTGSTRKEAEFALTEAGIRDLFEENYIVTFETTESEKASGKPFFEIRKRVRGALVMIGDSDSDEIGSALAGIPFIRIRTPGQTLSNSIRAVISLFEQQEAQ